MSSCLVNNQDSDEEVDLEALRLAALKSRKPKYVKRVNHNNLIPIVPIAVETPDFANTKIKVEKLSPPPEAKKNDESKPEGVNKENEEDKASNYSESTLHDQDILSMDDKEEEDSLERLMDQLEAEISGKVPLPTNANVLSSKNSSDIKDKRKKCKTSKTDGDDEIELVQVKTRGDCETVIEIRESASPEPAKEVDVNKPLSSEPLKSPSRRSRSLIRSRTRSRSPFSRGRSYRRSRSPYWSRSPRRSRSPFRRSRSPFWLSRRSRSSSRKLRSPLRRYRSPGRKRSPFSRFSRSRSRSFERRRPSWSLSPRRRSKSPYYRDSLPPRRNFNSPPGRIRRSFSPRDGSKSPRRRSRSPRGFARNSPFRRSKSPFRRSRSPFRRTKSLTRRSPSPFLHRSKSPIGKMTSPPPKRSSPGRLSPSKHSKSPPRRSASLERKAKSSEKASPKRRSKSPSKFEGSRRSPPRHLPPKDMGSNKSPTFRRVRSPLRAVNERNDKPRDRNRNGKRHRSLSRENHKAHDRRPYRSKHPRRFSPVNRNRKSADKDVKKSKSPKVKDGPEKTKEESSKQAPKDSTGPSIPVNPVLEARKKKFENLNVVDPTIDKKISLKSIKESTENVEDDEDALTINVEGNLWDESEESQDEFESRFKSGGTKKSRTVLSFRNLRENDPASRKIILNKPLVEDNRDKSGKPDGQDRWPGRRNDRWRSKYHDGNRNRVEDNDTNKSRFRDNDKSNVQSNTNTRTEKRSDRKPIVWSSKGERKRETESKTNEVTTTQGEAKEDKSKSSAKPSAGVRDRVGKVDSELLESDDFDKLISDFERELESDICLSAKEVNSTTSSVSQGDLKKSKISLKKISLESQTSAEPALKKHSGMRTVRATETCLSRLDKAQEEDNLTSFLEENNGTEAYTSEDNKEGPEDYIEDDDFFLEDSTEKKQRNRAADDDEDGQSDLRAVLSKRRNERLTKVVSLQENMPTRIVQSAFQGLGNKKSKRHFRETQSPLEFSSLDRNVKSAGSEGRRVLLLQRDRNPSMPAVKCTVPEVQPDTTIYQRHTRPIRRKRKLHRQADPNGDWDQEEEEEGFEMEEERQSRRFRLKRNVTLSSQFKI